MPPPRIPTSIDTALANEHSTEDALLSAAARHFIRDSIKSPLDPILGPDDDSERARITEGENNDYASKAVDHDNDHPDDAIHWDGTSGVHSPDKVVSHVQEQSGQEPEQQKEQPAGVTQVKESIAKSLDGKEQQTVLPMRTSSLEGNQPAQAEAAPMPPPKDDKPLPQDPPILSPTATGKQAVEGQDASNGQEAVKEAAPAAAGAATDDSKSEIQSIMEQFEDQTKSPTEGEIMSPRLEKAHPFSFPPRSSSLEAANTTISSPDPQSPITHQESQQSLTKTQSRTSLAETTANYRAAAIHPEQHSSQDNLASSDHASQIFKPPPPAPEPEPELPFDFHRFLEQLRQRTADPVAKFLRSFLLEFGKKQWMVHEQVKIISDFLEFISKKMAQCEPWRSVSDVEFDNAREGMEKLVMNRLYNQTFSPAIPPPEPLKGRRRLAQGPGRRGQHQEDVERDEILAQKVSIYGWVKEAHLDIRPVGDKGHRFLKLAQQELLKINNYRAPRDKVICILNCCKVIFGFLRSSASDQSADSFIPLLIYTVLHANPSHLVSNVQYILRFRNQDKLGGEAGYYISSLMGAVQFIENIGRTNLTVSDAEFEESVEAAVSAIAEQNREKEERARPPPPPPQPQPQPQESTVRPSTHILREKSTLSRPEVTPRNSLDGERASPMRNRSRGGGNSDAEDNAATGLLKSIQKPLSTIGRMFSDEPSPRLEPTQPVRTPQPGASPRKLSPAPPVTRPPANVGADDDEKSRPTAARTSTDEKPRENAEDRAARQASAEAAEAQRLQRAEHQVVVETLQGMFPDLDRDIISDVVHQKEGRVGLAVDACLSLNS